MATAVSVATAADAPAPISEMPKQGIKGVVRLEREIKLSEPAKYALLSSDSKGRPYVSLIVTESNKVLARTGAGAYREVLRPAAATGKLYAMPDVLGRSLGVTDESPKGAFYLLDSGGKILARVPKLSTYRYVFSEPTHSLIVSRPTGGWAGWPSLWDRDGSRNENMANGWPDTDAVDSVQFSPDGKRLAVLSSRPPVPTQFTVSVFSSTGALVWRAETPSEGNWSTADIAYSKSGQFLAVTSRTRLIVYDRQGRVVIDLPTVNESEQHIQFSGNDKHVAVGSGGAVRLFDIEAKSVRWEWKAKELQDAHILPAGEIHLSRVACSGDGRTVVASGFIWTWESDMTPQGEQTRKMVIHTEFVAVLRDGHAVDALKLPADTLLEDLSESHTAGTKAIAVSKAGDQIVIPGRQSILHYAIAR